MHQNRWDIARPFYIEIDVADTDIDRFGHVNNAVYIEYMERASWAHTDAQGIDWDAFRAMDAAFVVRRHEVVYLQQAQAGDRLQVATWISANDGRLALWRGFQIRRAADEQTLCRAQTQYISIRLSSSRPLRMPKRFVEVYRPVAQTQR